MKKLILILLLLPLLVVSQQYRAAVDRSCLSLKIETDGFVPIDKSDGLFNSTFLKADKAFDNYILNQRDRISRFYIFGEEVRNQDYANFFIEWDNYLEDCNDLVADTIEQYGVVKCELVPVKMNGKIVSYNTVPIDTTWSKCDCEDYKHYRNLRFSGLSQSCGPTVLSTNGNVGLGHYSSLSYYAEPEKAKNYFYISRNKICMIKKRKASFEDFFERWCVEKKLIEMN